MIPQIKKILFATDLSQNAFYAFPYAVDMARSHEAEIIVLRSVERIPNEVRFVKVLRNVEEKDRTEMVEQIRKLVQTFCKKVEDHIGSPCI